MAIGFVLINTKTGGEHDAYTYLKGVSEITELHPLFGEYNLIAKIEADNFDGLGKIVVDKIRTCKHVEYTKTLTGIKF